MPGARLILNTRYFHIARAGEQADGKHVMTKDAAMGLVNYVGTRESVQLNMPDQLALPGTDPPPLNLDPLDFKPCVAEKPVTKKQMDTITDLLREIPEAKNTLEYQDYRENKTIGNASELISRAAEIGLGYAVGIGEATNLVEYVGKRPGVDRVGEHGLFSSSPQVDIKQAQEDIANCKGNIWTHVVSLRREDADRLGYDRQKPWRDLILSQVDVIAKASNIPVSELKWYAGMHNTTHHPHIHLFVYSDNPKAGHLTKQGINEMKQAFSKVIFADERQQLYVHKTEMRDEIKQKADAILFGIQNHAADQFTEQEMKQLCEKMVQLAADLKGRTGKLQYGWIKDPNIREQVNSIMADLVEAPDIQKLYQLYCEDHQELQRMYRNDPTDATPLVKNKEFASIKNKIIREAAKLNSLSLSLPLEDRQEESGLTDEYESSAPQFEPEFPDMDREPDFPLLSEEESLYNCVPEERPENIPPEDLPPDWLDGPEKAEVLPKIQKENSSWFDVCMKKALDGDPKAKYQLGNLYYSGKIVLRDYENAAEWFTRASMDEIPEAQYRLAQMYHFGQGVEKDEVLSSALYRKAQMNFQLQAGSKPDPANELKMARMFFYGQGEEQDYDKAEMWYGLAAAHGNSMAQYELGKMYLYGIGIEKNEALGKEYCCDAYWSFRSSVTDTLGFDIGADVDSGLVDDGYSPDKSAAYLLYLLGRMEYAGEGVERNYEKAMQWYKLAAAGKHVHANYCIAKMYYAGEGVVQDYSEAKGWYRAAANGRDKYAYYALGKMYDTGTGTEQNYEKAAGWYFRAYQENVPYAQYRLAQLCEEGKGIDQDEEGAKLLYAKALEGFLEQEKQQPDASTELRIAQMYLYGTGVEPDVQAAIEWFQKSADNNEPRALYQMALLYRDGNGIEINEIYAEELFCKALAGFLRLEEETPSAQIEYKIAGIYAHGDGTIQDSEQAFQWYLASAENGHPHAAYCVAKAYESGNGTVQNDRSAINWYERAASQKDSYAMYALGKIYRDGIGVEQNPETSFRYFYSAAELGHEYAQYACANAFLKGIGVKRDLASAVRLYTSSAEKGNHNAEYQLGELYSADIEVSSDELLAHKYYAAALAGFLLQEEAEPDAQLEYRMANMFLNGKGSDPDFSTALRWFSESAQNGNAYAQYKLAVYFEEGQEIPQDTEIAQKYYAAALTRFTQQEEAEQDPQLQYRIANMFLNGKGTDPDLSTALYWFSKSAENGNAYAQYKLASYFDEGQEIPQDAEIAQKYYVDALAGFIQQDEIEPDAQLEYRIAMMYLRGKGVPADEQTALRWFIRGAEHGFSSASYQAGRLLEEMKTVPGNITQSRYYYALALKQMIQEDSEDPSPDREYQIGQMLYFGKGCTPDYSTAWSWFSKSAASGNPYAVFRQARMLQDGKGVLKDEVTAQKLYLQAMKRFLQLMKDHPEKAPELQFEIGTMYELGQGVKQDTEAAKEWYRQAAAGGNENAAEHLDQIQFTETQTAVNSVLGLLRFFAQDMGNNIEDSTTRKYRQDKRLMFKQIEQNHLQGAKYDHPEQAM